MLTSLLGSRNVDNAALGGQSAGVYGQGPDSGTLKQAAHGASENFRSQTAKQQRPLICNDGMTHGQLDKF